MVSPVLDQDLAPFSETAASAREATRAFLRRALHTRLPDEPTAADQVLLVVSELVTNAVRHTEGPCTLHLALRGDGIDIRVSDTSPHPPQPRPPHSDGTGGWGYLLVNHLTTNLHIEPTADGGKSICARIPW
ncbi:MULTISPECIES: ATP-binding protein [unclassified Streptomyces]|nr:ATP-binding protein [Streptomyces sp. NBC_01278]WSR23288.1 ATP-binding protein [Streptomyces sp. NBC_01205]